MKFACEIRVCADKMRTDKTSCMSIFSHGNGSFLFSTNALFDLLLRLPLVAKLESTVHAG